MSNNNENINNSNPNENKNNSNKSNESNEVNESLVIATGTVEAALTISNSQGGSECTAVAPISTSGTDKQNNQHSSSVDETLGVAGQRENNEKEQEQKQEQLKSNNIISNSSSVVEQVGVDREETATQQHNHQSVTDCISDVIGVNVIRSLLVNTSAKNDNTQENIQLQLKTSPNNNNNNKNNDDDDDEPSRCTLRNSTDRQISVAAASVVVGSYIKRADELTNRTDAPPLSCDQTQLPLHQQEQEKGQTFTEEASSFQKEDKERSIQESGFNSRTVTTHEHAATQQSYSSSLVDIDQSLLESGIDSIRKQLAAIEQCVDSKSNTSKPHRRIQAAAELSKTLVGQQQHRYSQLCDDLRITSNATRPPDDAPVDSNRNNSINSSNTARCTVNDLGATNRIMRQLDTLGDMCMRELRSSRVHISDTVLEGKNKADHPAMSTSVAAPQQQQQQQQQQQPALVSCREQYNDATNTEKLNFDTASQKIAATGCSESVQQVNKTTTTTSTTLSEINKTIVDDHTSYNIKNNNNNNSVLLLKCQSTTTAQPQVTPPVDCHTASSRKKQRHASSQAATNSTSSGISLKIHNVNASKPVLPAGRDSPTGANYYYNNSAITFHPTWDEWKRSQQQNNDKSNSNSKYFANQQESSSAVEKSRESRAASSSTNRESNEQMSTTNVRRTVEETYRHLQQKHSHLQSERNLTASQQDIGDEHQQKRKPVARSINETHVPIFRAPRSSPPAQRTQTPTPATQQPPLLVTHNTTNSNSTVTTNNYNTSDHHYYHQQSGNGNSIESSNLNTKQPLPIVDTNLQNHMYDNDDATKLERSVVSGPSPPPPPSFALPKQQQQQQHKQQRSTTKVKSVSAKSQRKESAPSLTQGWRRLETPTDSDAEIQRLLLAKAAGSIPIEYISIRRDPKPLLLLAAAIDDNATKTPTPTPTAATMSSIKTTKAASTITTGTNTSAERGRRIASTNTSQEDLPQYNLHVSLDSLLVKSRREASTGTERVAKHVAATETNEVRRRDAYTLTDELESEAPPPPLTDSEPEITAAPVQRPPPQRRRAPPKPPRDEMAKNYNDNDYENDNDNDYDIESSSARYFYHTRRLSRFNERGTIFTASTPPPVTRPRPRPQQQQQQQQQQQRTSAPAPEPLYRLELLAKSSRTLHRRSSYAPQSQLKQQLEQHRRREHMSTSSLQQHYDDDADTSDIERCFRDSAPRRTSQYGQYAPVPAPRRRNQHRVELNVDDDDRIVFGSGGGLSSDYEQTECDSEHYHYQQQQQQQQHQQDIIQEQRHQKRSGSFPALMLTTPATAAELPTTRRYVKHTYRTSFQPQAGSATLQSVGGQIEPAGGLMLLQRTSNAAHLSQQFEQLNLRFNEIFGRHEMQRRRMSAVDAGQQAPAATAAAAAATVNGNTQRYYKYTRTTSGGESGAASTAAAAASSSIMTTPLLQRTATATSNDVPSFGEIYQRFNASAVASASTKDFCRSQQQQQHQQQQQQKQQFRTPIIETPGSTLDKKCESPHRSSHHEHQQQQQHQAAVEGRAGYTSSSAWSERQQHHFGSTPLVTLASNSGVSMSTSNCLEQQPLAVYYQQHHQQQHQQQQQQQHMASTAIHSQSIDNSSNNITRVEGKQLLGANAKSNLTVNGSESQNQQVATGEVMDEDLLNALRQHLNVTTTTTTTTTTCDNPSDFDSDRQFRPIQLQTEA